MMKRRPLYWLTSFSALLVLSILLVACGGTPTTDDGGINGIDTTTPLPPTPTPTPTTKTFDGPNFTINYPREWSAETANVNGTQYVFSKDANTSFFVQPGESASTAAAVLEQAVQAYKTLAPDYADSGLTSQITYGSYTWTQVGFTGTFNGVKTTNVLLIQKNPKNANQYFLIYIHAPADQFDTAQTKYFKPSLDSFKVK